jgi:homoserine kinase
MEQSMDTVEDVEDGGEASNKTARSFTVRVPASTSNLGAGFDTVSLALKLYLTVRATVVPDAGARCSVTNCGEGSDSGLLSTTEDNLIFQAMSLAARHEGWKLPPVRLEVRNELPLRRGLGSSAAAIIAGIMLGALICERELELERVLAYALKIEGHADNVAAALHGGWVTSCVKPDGSVITVKRPWPADLRVVVVSPEALLSTAETRNGLPATIPRADVIYNLQRAALFGAAVEAGAYEMLWEAMKDRIHQPFRQSLVPGLTEALATKPQPGLIGIALSGSGPSVIALATDHLEDIGATIAESFRSRGVPATVRLLEVDCDGAVHLGQER